MLSHVEREIIQLPKRRKKQENKFNFVFVDLWTFNPDWPEQSTSESLSYGTQLNEHQHLNFARRSANESVGIR